MQVPLHNPFINFVNVPIGDCNYLRTVFKYFLSSTVLEGVKTPPLIFFVPFVRIEVLAHGNKYLSDVIGEVKEDDEERGLQEGSDQNHECFKIFFKHHRCA